MCLQSENNIHMIKKMLLNTLKHRVWKVGKVEPIFHQVSPDK